MDRGVIPLVLTFSSLERNSHIGIAEPVTRIVTQQPSRMQVVTLAMEVPLIIIMPALLFRLPCVLRVATLASRRQVRSHVQSQMQLPPVAIVVKQSITSPIVSRHGIVVSCILSHDLVCRFVLCCPARPVATTRLRVPPLCPSIRVSYARHGTRSRVHGIRNVFTRSRKSR